VSELDLNAPITEWELDEWTPDARAELTIALTESGIAHKWEETVLLAASSFEVDVEEILDDLENDEQSNEQDDDGDSADSKVLRQLSAVAQIISRNPSDMNSARTLHQILEEIDEASAPSEVSDSVWRQIKDLVNQIDDALASRDQSDESTAMDLSGRLFAILRSHV
jgi:hypothetical protein